MIKFPFILCPLTLVGFYIINSQELIPPNMYKYQISVHGMVMSQLGALTIATENLSIQAGSFHFQLLDNYYLHDTIPVLVQLTCESGIITF